MLEKIKAAGEFTPDDRKELQALLGNKSLQRALGHIAREGEQMNQLTRFDLTRQEGLNEALAQQGVVKGIALTIEKLIELAQET